MNYLIEKQNYEINPVVLAKIYMFGVNVIRTLEHNAVVYVLIFIAT